MLLTALQPYRPTALQPYSPTALQPYNPTARCLQPYSPTALQPYSSTALQPVLTALCSATTLGVSPQSPGGESILQQVVCLSELLCFPRSIIKSEHLAWLLFPSITMARTLCHTG